MTYFTCIGWRKCQPVVAMDVKISYEARYKLDDRKNKKFSQPPKLNRLIAGNDPHFLVRTLIKITEIFIFIESILKIQCTGK